MIWLGVPARCTYEAADYQSGLLGVYAMVERPDMTTDGPFPMREGLNLSAGAYHFNYRTKETDPEGRYRVLFFSPQENRRASVRLEFCKRPLQQVEVTTGAPLEVVVQMPEQETTEVEVLSARSTTVDSVAEELTEVHEVMGQPQQVEVDDDGVTVVRAIDDPGSTIEVQTC